MKLIKGINEFFLNRGNFNSYQYSNIIRSQSNAVTSCGTNAVWSMHRFTDVKTEQEREFNFLGKTIIEDTEASHEQFKQGEESVCIK